MKYFDSHIHFFPDALAERALSRLKEKSQSPCYTEGTFSDTLNKLFDWGCVGGMALHIATNAKQQNSVNSFALESQREGIFCFGSVFPFAENAIEELHRIKESGLYGVKLHPDYQEFTVDDERVKPIYAEAEKLSLPIAFHTGFDPYSPDFVHCKPEALAKIADEFPKLTIIAAHMGGMMTPKESAEHLAGKKNVYFDTAVASLFLNSAQLSELIKLHGADKVLFATDCPWSTVPTERDLLEAADLSDIEREKIAWRNSAELFGLDI